MKKFLLWLWGSLALAGLVQETEITNQTAIINLLNGAGTAVFIAKQISPSIASTFPLVSYVYPNMVIYTDEKNTQNFCAGWNRALRRSMTVYKVKSVPEVGTVIINKYKSYIIQGGLITGGSAPTKRLEGEPMVKNMASQMIAGLTGQGVVAYAC
jgi:hypothetical protein